MLFAKNPPPAGHRRFVDCGDRPARRGYHDYGRGTALAGGNPYVGTAPFRVPLVTVEKSRQKFWHPGSQVPLPGEGVG